MSQVEYDAQDMLMEGTDPLFIADELIRRWHTTVLDEVEAHAVCQFLMQSGFYASLFDQMALKILKNQSLPWSDVAYMLKKFDAYIDQDVIDLFFQWLEDNEKLHLLAFMSHKETFLEANSENDWSKHIKKVQEHLTQIWGDIQRQQIQPVDLTSSDAIEEAIELLQETPQSVPKKPQSPRKKKPAKKLAKKKSIKKKKTSSTSLQPQKLSQKSMDKKFKTDLKLQQESLIHRIFKQVELESQSLLKQARKEILPDFIKQAKAQPHYAYDLAVSLFVMGAYKEALRILDQHFKSFNRPVDFLKLEIYCDHHHYLKLLQQIDQMSKHYFDEDPDTILSLLYFRAKALWGLNKNSEAIDLMSEIVRQQSHFRCADLILSKWRTFT